MPIKVCVYMCAHLCMCVSIHLYVPLYVCVYTCMCPDFLCVLGCFYHKHMGYWLKCKFMVFTPDLETFSATSAQAVRTAQLKNHHPRVLRKRLWVGPEGQSSPGEHSMCHTQGQTFDLSFLKGLAHLAETPVFGYGGGGARIR